MRGVGRHLYKHIGEGHFCQGILPSFDFPYQYPTYSRTQQLYCVYMPVATAARVHADSRPVTIPSADSIVNEFTLRSTFNSPLPPPWNQGMAAAITCHTQLTPHRLWCTNLHLKLKQSHADSKEELSANCRIAVFTTNQEHCTRHAFEYETSELERKG